MRTVAVLESGGAVHLLAGRGAGAAKIGATRANARTMVLRRANIVANLTVFR